MVLCVKEADHVPATPPPPAFSAINRIWWWWWRSDRRNWLWMDELFSHFAVQCISFFSGCFDYGDGKSFMHRIMHIVADWCIWMRLHFYGAEQATIVGPNRGIEWKCKAILPERVLKWKRIRLPFYYPLCTYSTMGRTIATKRRDVPIFNTNHRFISSIDLSSRRVVIGQGTSRWMTRQPIYISIPAVIMKRLHKWPSQVKQSKATEAHLNGFSH